MKKAFAILFILSSFIDVHAQHEGSSQSASTFHPFVAYELGEAMFNRFQSYSGEIGVRLPNHHLLRLTHMNVRLTEKHLSSSFAGAVDGSGVKGTFWGFEAFYDVPLLWKSLYLGPSIGYYRSAYEHVTLPAELENHSMTLGAAISIRETDLFGIQGLYYTLSLPMRLSLNPIKETMLGEATIVNSTFDNNIWLFIGYEF
ncbi:MAG: hypothetical protein KTR24_15205 [Saprospiraceae bacterium]|nr:hypothetical protein [Saprospiraceae bacterium]